jgi:hypothetical protein
MIPKVVCSIPELLDVVRARRDALDLPHEGVDHLAGLPSGYFSKLVCDPPVRGFGAMSLQAVLGALALGIARVEIVEDVAQAERMRPRWRPRKRRPERKAAPE